MSVLWILLLACSQHVVCGKRFDSVSSSGRSHNIFYKLMKSRYGDIELTSTADVGSPLFLTPFIERNELKKAREAAYVNPDSILPGLDSYAGYLTVNQTYNSNLWFWYFPVKNQDIEKTPWILWLQGGPGASSLYGLFEEIGPLQVVKGTIKEHKYSWGKNHSLLFIDNPVGTGFSFTEDDNGYATRQLRIGEELYSALQQFLTIFPELRRAPLTIAGESYAGKHIPSLGYQIHIHKNRSQPINLYGLAIGNGFIDPQTLQRYSYFVREVGLVDDNVANEMRHHEEEVVEAIKKGDLYGANNHYSEVLYTFSSNALIPSIYNYLSDDSFDAYSAFTILLNSDQVRKAIHVGNKTYRSLSWVVHGKLSGDFMASAKPWLEVLLDNYQVMLYNGHLDVIVAYHPSVNTYNSLNFTGTGKYAAAKRQPWVYNKKLAGYYKTGGNLLEVMVRGAGHMVPIDQPANALMMISAFVRGEPLSSDLLGGNI